MSRKIFFVDDDKMILNLLEYTFQSRDEYEVITFQTGEACLENLQQEPNLIVLDVVLPKKNGFQVCRQLKTTPQTEEIKILLLTSKSQDSDRFWGLKQGADEYK